MGVLLLITTLFPPQLGLCEQGDFWNLVSRETNLEKGLELSVLSSDFPGKGPKIELVTNGQ